MRRVCAIAGALCLAACSSKSPSATDAGQHARPESGTTIDSGTPDSAVMTSPCTSATLFAGDPKYSGTTEPTSGTGILTDPPQTFRKLVWDGSVFYSVGDDGQEIWMVDTSAASPVETLVAGAAQSTPMFSAGACSAARLGNVYGLAVLPDHSLVAADFNSAALVLVSNPQSSSTCQVKYLAGTNTPQSDVSTALTGGDVDGTGGSAQVSSPEFPVTNSDGKVYFVDSGNNKLKSVDESGNVKTMVTLPAACTYWDALDAMGGKLYALGNTGSALEIVQVDPSASPATMSTFMTIHPGDLPVLDPSVGPDASSLTNDGTSFFIAGNGYLWQIAPATKKVSWIAGIGEYNPCGVPPTGYDPTAMQSAGAVFLDEQTADHAVFGANDFLSFHNGALYYTARTTLWSSGTPEPFTEKLACPTL